MSKFTATITVEAEFHNALEAEILTGEVINTGSAHPSQVQGYLVTEEDGRKRFIPKEVFEKTYRPSDTFLDRLYIERDELEKKLKKLEAFLATDAESKLLPKDVELLELQANSMHRYLNYLNKRITRATTEK